MYRAEGIDRHSWRAYYDRSHTNRYIPIDSEICFASSDNISRAAGNLPGAILESRLTRRCQPFMPKAMSLDSRPRSVLESELWVGCAAQVSIPVVGCQTTRRKDLIYFEPTTYICTIQNSYVTCAVQSIVHIFRVSVMTHVTHVNQKFGTVTTWTVRRSTEFSRQAKRRFSANLLL